MNDALTKVEIGHSIIELKECIEITLSKWFIKNRGKLDKEDFDRAYSRVWETTIKTFVEYEEEVLK